MFTGIITDFATVRRFDRRGGDARMEITTAYDMATVDIGASIACNGCCLTVVDKGADWYAVDAAAETLAVTTLGGFSVGRRVNLERALCLGDELGGHVVSGHVDGIATVIDIRPDGDSRRYTFQVPDTLAPFIAPKGSVALDGVSLTVNEVDGSRFGVCIIPHTQAVTTFGTYQPGDTVNVEIDMLARYVARLMGKI